MANLSSAAKEMAEQPNAIREIMCTKAEILLAGGWGDHEEPPGLRESYIETVSDPALFHGSSRYCRTRGLPSFIGATLESIEHRIYSRNGLAPENLIVGMGSTELTAALLKATLDPGDTVLLPNPTYANYLGQIAGEVEDVRVERFAAVSKDLEFLPRTDPSRVLDEVRNIFREKRPKMVLFPTPDNPTGQVWPEEVVDGILEEAARFGAWVALDVAYRPFLLGRKTTDY